MRKKIFAIATILFLSLTSFIVNAETAENQQKIFTVSTADIPEWSEGYFWEYEMDLLFDLSVLGTFGINVEAESSNLILIVTEIDEINNEYILELEGEAEGLIIVNGAGLGPVSGISGQAIIEKDTLATKSFTVSIAGHAFNLVPFDFYYEIDFNPYFNYLDLPINEQEEPWEVSSIASIVLGGAAIGEKFPYEDIKDEEISTTIELSEVQDLTTPAGEFLSYKLQGDAGEQSEIWYSPDAGNIIKILEELPLRITIFDAYGVELEGDLTMNYDMILTKTNYDLNNQPPKIPNSPNGNNKGKPGEEYTYSAKTSDPEADQIYYMFDWDDGTYSDWLGPYDSGETCEETHTWSEKGDYKIKVRAKDAHDLESYWSDPLSVSMAKSKIILFRSLFDLLKIRFNYFRSFF